MNFLAFTIFLWFLANELVPTKSQEKSFKKPNLYNFIDKKILKNFNQNKNQLKDKCMINLINEVFRQNGTTYLFISDGQQHENLIYNLQLNFVHSYYTKPHLLATSNFVSYHHLLIFQNEIKIENVIERMMPIQGTKFFILVQNYEETTEIFKTLWKYRVVDVVAAFEVNKTVLYYTYFPYDNNHCGGVGTPYSVAKCDTSHGIFFHKQKLFPKKNGNLYKCPIDVTFVHNIPSSYYSNTHKLVGWEVDLIKDVINHLNGVPRFKLLSSRRKVYENSEGYRHLVKNSDIGGGTLVSLKSLSKTDFCLYGQSACTVWVVPKRNAVFHSASFIFKVFPSNVWFFILFSFLTMAAAYKLFYKATWANVLFKLIPFLLGTTIRTKKTSRALGGTWLCFCVFMNAIYQSGYQSTILVPDTNPQLSTTNEILGSNLKIMGLTDILKDNLPYLKAKFNVSNRRLKLINRQMTYEEWLYRMTVKKDSAYLGFKETIHYHIDRTELAKELNIPDTCNMKYLLSFVLKKNSHLTMHLVKYSNRLNENGFVVFFMRKHLSKVSKQNIPNKMRLSPSKSDGTNIPLPIDLNKLYPVFIFHATGTIIAFQFFLLELMSTWKWKNIKKNIIDILKSAWSCNT